MQGAKPVSSARFAIACQIHDGQMTAISYQFKQFSNPI